MSGIEYIEARLSEETGAFSIIGSTNAWSMGMILLNKHIPEHKGVNISTIFDAASEMQMDLVAAYSFRVDRETWTCHCFQGDADVIADMLNDPKYEKDAAKFLEAWNNRTKGPM